MERVSYEQSRGRRNEINVVLRNIPLQIDRAVRKHKMVKERKLPSDRLGLIQAQQAKSLVLDQFFDQRLVWSAHQKSGINRARPESIGGLLPSQRFEFGIRFTHSA